MKMTMIFTLLLGCLFFSTNSLAEGEVDKMINKKESNQSTEKKSRRKKVQMCHECGKPETECECEGEEHGVKDEHHDEEEE